MSLMQVVGSVRNAILALGLCTAVGAAGCAPSSPSLSSFAKGEMSKLAVSKGEPGPATTFVDASGAARTLADFKGKVVVVNLWGEWCPPCVEEMPTLAALQKDTKAEGVEVVAIAFGRDKERDSAKQALERLTAGELAFYYDADFAFQNAARALNFPTTLIYDREGREVARLERPADWHSPEALALVRAVAAPEG